MSERLEIARSSRTRIERLEHRQTKQASQNGPFKIRWLEQRILEPHRAQ
jgi:hypothetical protein